jgi:transposase
VPGLERGDATVCCRGSHLPGRTLGICAATTVQGWLPCTGVKEGYFLTPNLLNWLQTALLPALYQQSPRSRVVVMDNNSTHIGEAIISAIGAKVHIVCFLPPYSPDFNPIELSFSVLKAWFQRNYVWTRSNHRSFGDYFVWAIGQSRCDRFAREQFRYSVGGLYLEEGEPNRFQEWLRVWEQETVEMGAEDWVEEELRETEEGTEHEEL